jgi:hypothetical protein
MKNIVQVEFKESWDHDLPFEIIFIGDFEDFKKQDKKRFWYDTNLKKYSNPFYFTINDGNDNKVEYKITKLNEIIEGEK